MTGRKSRHILQLPGPALEQPFRITHGLAAVHAVEPIHSVCVLTGGTWPGLAALDAATAERLEACVITLTPGAAVDLRPSPAQIDEGVRSIQAQLLGRGGLGGRLAYLEQLGVPVAGVNQTTVGALIGTRRETAFRTLREQQRAPGAPQDPGTPP
ncbi:hypothetical protein [Deinococcus rufus]|uniref:Uncharacterized protein n=1 Tax=Deinococcus rufus TaxID=2136097 RepID=A0ABV7Z943_9DEIO